MCLNCIEEEKKENPTEEYLARTIDNLSESLCRQEKEKELLQKEIKKIEERLKKALLEAFGDNENESQILSLMFSADEMISYLSATINALRTETILLHEACGKLAARAGRLAQLQLFWEEGNYEEREEAIYI